MITIEQIDEFRKRTNSSYGDAKYFLEKNGGDILDAIIEFEKSKINKSQGSSKRKNQGGQKFIEFVQKGFENRICVEDKNGMLFSMPVILLVLLIPFWVITILFFVFLYIIGYRFHIRNAKSQNFNVKSFFDNISEKLKDSGTNKDRAENALNTSNTYKTDSYNVDESRSIVVSNKNQQEIVDTDRENPESEFGKDDGYNEYTIE